MLNPNLSTLQESPKQFENRIDCQKFKSKATALGDRDVRVVAADPDPEMITNSHYWSAYCQGQYQRYLKKYGINQVNEA